MLFTGAVSALAWDYFFLPPRFTFVITSAEDGILFGLYFVVAIVLGQLVARIRAQELAERHREERATALYHLTREFAQAGSRDEVVWQLVAEVNRVFRANAAVVMPGKNSLAVHPDSSAGLDGQGIARRRMGVSQSTGGGQIYGQPPGLDCIAPTVDDRT